MTWELFCESTHTSIHSARVWVPLACTLSLADESPVLPTARAPQYSGCTESVSSQKRYSCWETPRNNQTPQEHLPSPLQHPGLSPLLGPTQDMWLKAQASPCHQHNFHTNSKRQKGPSTTWQATEPRSGAVSRHTRGCTARLEQGRAPSPQRCLQLLLDRGTPRVHPGFSPTPPSSPWPPE